LNHRARRDSDGSIDASASLAARFGVVGPKRANHGSDVRPMGLVKQPYARESRTDRVGLFDELALSNVKAGCGQPERERERGERVRHHRADA
jgi:hypothetical protein